MAKSSASIKIRSEYGVSSDTFREYTANVDDGGAVVGKVVGTVELLLVVLLVSIDLSDVLLL